MADLHDLIRRMADELDEYRQLLLDDRAVTHRLADEARTALAAEPQGEGVSDTQLLDMAMYDHGFDRMDCTDGNREWMTYEAARDSVLSFARAVLARWGCSAPPPEPQSMRRVYINNPTQIAECGGPCTEGGPEACDCGALWRDEPALAAEPQGEGPGDADKKPLSLVTDCYIQGMPPNPHQDWQSYFTHCQATGVISGLRLQAVRPTPSVNDSLAARAALAEPQGEGLTDEELTQEWRQLMGAPEAILAQPMIDFARAILARWGRPAPPLADGEVGELVAWLRDGGEDAAANGWDHQAQQFDRAADLLTRLALPPVPVSERLPGPEDCDAEGRCWWWDGEWGLVEQRFADYIVTHWLPIHALPLPREVQP